MSHRIKRFAEIAIFASFYLFAVVDSILGFRGHHVDTKSVQPNDFFSLPKIARLVSLFRLFERNHQRVDLTDAGRVFVEEAREAVLRAERAVLVAKATFSGADEILNIGKSPHGDPCLVSTLLSIHLPLFPGLRVNLWSDYSNELAH
jgi:hypothetical protein